MKKLQRHWRSSSGLKHKSKSARVWSLTVPTTAHSFTHVQEGRVYMTWIMCILLYNTCCLGFTEWKADKGIAMETSYRHNQLTINSNNCKDTARGLGSQRSINLVLTKHRPARWWECELHTASPWGFRLDQAFSCGHQMCQTQLIIEKKCKHCVSSANPKQTFSQVFICRNTLYLIYPQNETPKEPIKHINC